jgi:hypothetical protein
MTAKTKAKASPVAAKGAAVPAVGPKDGDVAEIVGGVPVIKPGQRLRASFSTPDELQKAMAELAISPSANGAAAIQRYGEKIADELSLGALDIALQGAVERAKSGDMGDIEAMLVTQAFALQSMFASLSRKAQVQTHAKSFEPIFRMAMKAQSQCRMTLETLSAIKNPPVIFAKQMNVSSGPQQVNNGVAAPSALAREEKTIRSNELLEEQHAQRLDTGATGSAIRADTELEAMGKLDRAANR